MIKGLKMYNFWLRLEQMRYVPQRGILWAMKICEYDTSLSKELSKEDQLIYDQCLYDASMLERNFNRNTDGPWFIYLEAHLIEKIRPDLVDKFLKEIVKGDNYWHLWEIEMLDRFNYLKMEK